MAKANASQKGRTVADPNAAYLSMRDLWSKARAICSGERFVKERDSVIDAVGFTNLLIPFSTTMTQAQYNFYRAEAELPGMVGQYARMLVGGLLRKQPQLKLPDDAPAECSDWIMHEFGQDGSPIAAFLDEAVWDEIQTSRAWVHVSYPNIPKALADEMTAEDFRAIRPYPVMFKGESIINWKVGTDVNTGREVLTQLVVRGFSEDYAENEFHPTLIDTVWVHELDAQGFYQVRQYRRSKSETNVDVINGHVQLDAQEGSASTSPLQGYELYELNATIMAHGVRLKLVPFWPLNGSIACIEPILTSLVDREVALYNKVSRRNHLLYGAATYTPVITTDMDEDAFDELVAGGLGSWIRLGKGETADILATPTDALADMDRTIAASLEEMARMGIRMLSPETAQSGVALDIRNAAQTAQLGTLNMKISNQMSDIIAFMINWRFGTEYKAADIKFTMSADFNPAPLGADWLRLITEWYEARLLPRNTWLEILKQNDILSPDYNDEDGKKEIAEDDLIPGGNNDDLAHAKRLLDATLPPVPPRVTIKP
jgi:hypothetical protein